jgi:transposase-like protein
MKAPYVRRDWTEAEHAELWRLKCEGVPVVEIARRIGRANSSCVGRLAQCDSSGKFVSRSAFNVFRATPEQDAIIAEMSAKGISSRGIADRLGLSRNQVWGRLRTLAEHKIDKPVGPGLIAAETGTPRSPAIRTCLMCCRLFNSTHAGNRRCVRCRERVSAYDTPYNPGIAGAI